MKWNMLRKFIKNVSGNNTIRSDYDDRSYRKLYEKCASNMLLLPVKDKLLAPPDFSNKHVQDSLHWTIRDCWKKQRTSEKASGTGEMEVDYDDYDDGEEAPKRNKKRKTGGGGGPFLTPPTTSPRGGRVGCVDAPSECSKLYMCPH
jgi:hypothetical protein